MIRTPSGASSIVMVLARLTTAAVGLSHSPLIGKNDPAPDVLASVDPAVNRARTFVREFDPELVVLYAPDHYNGFFYKEIRSF